MTNATMTSDAQPSDAAAGTTADDEPRQGGHPRQETHCRRDDTPAEGAPREADPRFEDWVRARQDVLLRSARRMTDSHADAQDLLQSALARTFPVWDGITDKRNADAYVRRVLVNTRTSLWRSRRLQEYAVATDELPERPVEDATEQHAQRDLLEQAMRRLSVRQRRVVAMRYYQDLSTPQTADALGVSTGTVKSTLHRALVLLREEIRQLQSEDGQRAAPRRHGRRVSDAGTSVAGRQTSRTSPVLTFPQQLGRRVSSTERAA